MRKITKKSTIDANDVNNGKKSTTVKLEMNNHSYLKEVGKFNNRTISGQANWVCRVVSMLEDDYPDIYAKISQKLNSTES